MSESHTSDAHLIVFTDEHGTEWVRKSDYDALKLSGSQMSKPGRVRGKGKRSAEPPPRLLRTVAAARYLGLSASLLQKYRSMGPDDPGMHGPAYIKVSANIVLYEISALDDWLDARKLAALESR